MTSVQTALVQPNAQTTAMLHGSRVKRPLGLFPHFLCRIGGLPASVVAAKQATRSAAAAMNLLDSAGALSAFQQQLSDALYAEVPRHEDQRSRRALIRIRRDVFNTRRLGPDDIASCNACIPETLAADVEYYQRLFDAHRRLQSVFRETYNHEVEQCYGRLRVSLANADFQTSVVLSSRPLHSALQRYVEAEPEYATENRKVMRALLRYVLRAGMKATPFSRFCVVVPGEVVLPTTEADTLALRGSLSRIRSQVRLNKQIYAALISHCRTHPPIQSHLLVTLNPTISQTDDRLYFLARTGNREVFQRVANNAAISAIRELIAVLGAAPMGTLIESLVNGQRIDAGEPELAAYVAQLAGIGLLEVSAGIDVQDPDWDLPLSAMLQGIPDDFASSAASLLAELRQNATTFTVASPKQQAKSLDDLARRVKTVVPGFTSFDARLQETPLYEDATADACAILPMTAGTQAALSTLEEWIALTSALAWPRADLAAMQHYFSTEFNGRQVPLLEFYERYYMDHYKEHLWHAQQRRREPHKRTNYNVSNPFGLTLVDEMLKAEQGICRALTTEWSANPTAESVNLTREQLVDAVRSVPPVSPTAVRSSGVFVTYVPPSDSTSYPLLVLKSGGYLPGFGKYFSRFLHMLPSTVLSAVRDRYSRVPGVTLAEINDDGHFNGNLHPPLLPMAIAYPGMTNTSPLPTVACNDLLVAQDDNDPWSLMLIDSRTGGRVLPVDLGFLNIRMRPPLYQMLTRFSPAGGFALSLSRLGRGTLVGANKPGLGATGAGRLSDAVTQCPRLTYEHCVVLARRQWLVEACVDRPPMTDVDGPNDFAATTAWRHRHSLPEQAYYRVVGGTHAEHAGSGGSTVSGESTSDAEATLDATPAAKDRHGGIIPVSKLLRKPQYLDFSNPVLVDLLHHSLRRCNAVTLSFEEQLPTVDQLLCAARGKRVTELVLQYDSWPSEPPVPKADDKPQHSTCSLQDTWP